MLLDKVRIGTSGFSYRDWLGNFYPQFCPQPDFLQFYSSQFCTVEIDSTFYRIPRPETVQKWTKVTPENFVFAAKFPQTVTHGGDIQTRIDSARAFIEVMRHCGSKLGPLLLQFPYSFTPEQRSLLVQLIESLPDEGRFALELRNKKWLQVETIFELLRKRNIAFCLIEHPWMPRQNLTTADFTYVRFLGDHKKIEDDFSYVRFDKADELEFWKEVIAGHARNDIETFVYFNNHFSGHAPTTANNLKELLRTAP